MASSTDVLAEAVRAKRHAIDNDLELLRVRTRLLEPRAMAARWGARWGPIALPVAAAATATWLWRKRRRSVESLQDLLVSVLNDLYRAEVQLGPALRRLSDAASNPDLASLLNRHCEETRSHVERLTRVFRSVGARPARGTSATIAAIDEEGKRRLKRETDADVRDAWLIATAQRAEHLEIANYGTARTYARTLGHTYAAQLLQQTLEEERAVDDQLTRLAERFVNPDAIR
jgi:ferritin-like metal-binding protein YciE